MKKFLATLLLLIIPTQTLAFGDYFIFGLRLQENNYSIIPKIETKYNTRVPLVSLIYDDFSKSDFYYLANTFKVLGKDRVYHISINPFGHNLQELISSPNHAGWEAKYRLLFRLIKKMDVKVIFRSLHEMNGGWYSRASDPVRFPIFWKMMWNWSREEGLDRSNILFDFSVNSQDLPVADFFRPTQNSPLINCNQDMKKKTGCFTFEDYYPGDDYVDLIGVTIYNWGQGARKESWAVWRDPIKVIDDPGYRTFTRMKKTGKPIFIDEAGSTSIKIDGEYNESSLPDIFKSYHTPIGGITATGSVVKNEWIKKLNSLYTDSQVVGGAYFNADVTYGLKDRRQIGELDWKAIDPDKNFAYPALLNILNSDNNLDYPTFYFDLPAKLVDSRKWLSEDEMLNLHKFISSIMVYKEGNIIVNGSYKGTLKYPKYQYFLEKKLEKDPIICEYIKKGFTKINCSETKNIKNLSEKKKALEYIIKKVTTSPIRLSNWGVWQQIEDYKTLLNYKVKTPANYKIYQEIVDYLNNYEKNFLNLK